MLTSLCHSRFSPLADRTEAPHLHVASDRRGRLLGFFSPQPPKISGRSAFRTRCASRSASPISRSSLLSSYPDIPPLETLPGSVFSPATRSPHSPYSSSGRSSSRKGGSVAATSSSSPLSVCGWEPIKSCLFCARSRLLARGCASSSWRSADCRCRPGPPPHGCGNSTSARMSLMASPSLSADSPSCPPRPGSRPSWEHNECSPAFSSS